MSSEVPHTDTPTPPKEGQAFYSILLCLSLIAVSVAVYVSRPQSDRMVTDTMLMQCYDNALSAVSPNLALQHYTIAYQAFKNAEPSDTVMALGTRIYIGYIRTAMLYAKPTGDITPEMLIALTREFYQYQPQRTVQVFMAEVLIKMGNFLEAETILISVLDDEKSTLAAKFYAQYLLADLRVMQERPLEALGLLNNEAFASLDSTSEMTFNLNAIAAKAILSVPTDSLSALPFIEDMNAFASHHNDLLYAGKYDLIQCLEKAKIGVLSSGRRLTQGEHFPMSLEGVEMMRLAANMYVQAGAFEPAVLLYHNCIKVYTSIEEAYGKPLPVLYFIYRRLSQCFPKDSPGYEQCMAELKKREVFAKMIQEVKGL